MEEINIKVINAFSVADEGGNPAGVVLAADRFSNIQKQEIASKVGLSETAFVSKSNQAAFKLDFFTPERQIAHCGHATIATFNYLKKQGYIDGDHSSKETMDGNRDIYFKNGMAFMEQREPSFQQTDVTAVLRSLGLKKEDLLSGFVPEIVNTGNAFMMIPVANQHILKHLQPNNDQIKSISKQYGLIGYYVFTTLEPGDEAIATSRMFGPYYGIMEEAATGMAAGPLVCYLYEKGLEKRTFVSIHQGWFMPQPSPSMIHVELQMVHGKIERLYAGGTAHVSNEVTLKI